MAVNRRKLIETLEAVNSLYTDLGFFPTLKELREELSLKSNSPVIFRLKHLIELELVSRKDGIHTITITKKGKEYLQKNSSFEVGNSIRNWQPRRSFRFQSNGTTTNLDQYM